jgi:hypothetical protein
VKIVEIARSSGVHLVASRTRNNPQRHVANTSPHKRLVIAVSS